jgi:hypothetical protein
MRLLATGDEESELLATIRGLGSVTTSVLSRQTISNGDDQVTHHILSHKTPGVISMPFVRTSDGMIQARIIRGSYLPSELWYFPPRSRTHDTGGFIIERYEHRKMEATIHPSVLIACCAYRTLDEEAARRTRRNSTWARGLGIVSKILRQKK